jgi:hypothetical protein
MQILQIKNQPLQLQHVCADIPVGSVIEEVIQRSEIDLDDGYFPWASEFALLSRRYITRVASCTPTGHWTKRYPDALKSGGGGDRQELDLGHARLIVDYLQPAGWFIEVLHDDVDDSDARILTAVREDMPVLCPSFQSAIRLAEASFSNPHYHLYWHPTIVAGACS